MNEKFNWKRFSITIILVLITACATAGTTWYFMNDANQIYKETINALQDQNNKLSKGEDDTDIKEDAEKAGECEDFTPVIGFKPGGLFTETEKQEIKTKIADPYIYYINNVEAQENRGVISLVIEEYPEDERPANYYYGIDVVVENGYSGGWLFGESGNINYWIPECMNECFLTQSYVDNFPNNLPDSYSII